MGFNCYIGHLKLDLNIINAYLTGNNNIFDFEIGTLEFGLSFIIYTELVVNLLVAKIYESNVYDIGGYIKLSLTAQFGL